jgi:hypothetical protein
MRGRRFKRSTRDQWKRKEEHGRMAIRQHTIIPSRIEAKRKRKGARMAWWCTHPIDLVKPIHIELADEAAEVVVLEVRAQNGPAKFADVGHDERGAVLCPRDERSRLWVVDHTIRTRKETDNPILELVGMIRERRRLTNTTW